MITLTKKSVFGSLTKYKSNYSFRRSYTSKSKNKDVVVEFDPSTFKTHRCEAPKLSTTTNREELLGYYREMNLMRRTGIAADNMYKQKLIRGFLHLYNGQEAVASGLESVLTKEDSVVTAYRDHAFMLTRRCGGTVKEVLAELLGKSTGCSKGKGGSMHMYKASSNFYGGNGIVGAQVPLGAGLAFAHKYLNTGRVAFTYYGDGAANQGQLNEAFNMSYLWKLPAIFICENNEYGMGTAVERASATKEFYTRGDYVPGVWVDGMDVLAVKECGKFARDWAQSGKGPLIIEAKTYRYYGHSMSDPGTSYRSRTEIQEVRETRDPITRLKRRILDLEMATEEELQQIEKEVKQEVDEAIQFAKSSPDPKPEELYTDVYDVPTRIRAVEYSNSFIP